MHTWAFIPKFPVHKEELLLCVKVALAYKGGSKVLLFVVDRSPPYCHSGNGVYRSVEMPAKITKISDYVLERAKSFRPALAIKLKLHALSTHQAIDYLVTAALDAEGVPEVSRSTARRADVEKTADV